MLDKSVPYVDVLMHRKSNTPLPPVVLPEGYSFVPFQAGDEKAALVYQAMALNVAKNIAKLAVSVKGRVDAILLTGGIAHSRLFTGWIQEYVAFIAPVVCFPGEHEMEALALGCLRVLRGEEKARIFSV